MQAGVVSASNASPLATKQNHCSESGRVRRKLEVALKKENRLFWWGFVVAISFPQQGRSSSRRGHDLSDLRRQFHNFGITDFLQDSAAGKV